MLVLQLNYGQRPVYDLCYPHGDHALQNKISSIAKGYVRRLESACVNIGASVTVSDCFFEHPLRRFTPTNIFGNLSTCPAPELRSTAVAVQRDIARAITRWEIGHGIGSAHPQPQPQPQQSPPPQPSVTPAQVLTDKDFREIDHPFDSYWEEQEHQHVDEE